MSNAAWWERNEEEICVVRSDSSISAARALPPTGLIYSARMQGQEMRHSDGVFTQFYEALRLPDYFGWNWNALRDCLTDLHWISAKHFLLTIDDADTALSECAEEREILFRVLNDAVKFWAGKPELPGQEKITFQAVLLCPPDVQEEVLREIRTSRRHRPSGTSHRTADSTGENRAVSRHGALRLDGRTRSAVRLRAEAGASP